MFAFGEITVHFGINLHPGAVDARCNCTTPAKRISGVPMAHLSVPGQNQIHLGAQGVGTLQVGELGQGFATLAVSIGMSKSSNQRETQNHWVLSLLDAQPEIVSSVPRGISR